VSSSDNPFGIDQSSAAEMITAGSAVLILQGNLPRYFTFMVSPKKKTTKINKILSTKQNIKY